MARAACPLNVCIVNLQTNTSADLASRIQWVWGPALHLFFQTNQVSTWVILSVRSVLLSASWLNQAAILTGRIQQLCAAACTRRSVPFAWCIVRAIRNYARCQLHKCMTWWAAGPSMFISSILPHCYEAHSLSLQPLSMVSTLHLLDASWSRRISATIFFRGPFLVDQKMKHAKKCHVSSRSRFLMGGVW